MLPADPFGRSRLPAGFDRASRVRLIAEAAEALLAGQLPHPAARLFLAGALVAWLRDGGRIGALERDYLKVAAPRRSTATPARLWQRECSTRRATHDQDGGNLSASIDGDRDDPADE